MALIDKNHPALSITRQTALLNISRASIYYTPRVDDRYLAALAALDALYTKRPFYGSRRMRHDLRDEFGISLGRDHVRRLMKILGIAAIYPQPHTSQSAPGHQTYPYLLRNLPIIRPNQVWGTDITYIRLAKGFCYLTAILDWHSRYVVAWELSETMEKEFCLAALRSALATAVPEIHNSDQGSQYTSNEYTNVLKNQRIHISMDGRGRCMDNIFTERLWRSVKYEDVYLNDYRTMHDVRAGLSRYFPFYNEERRHQGLAYRTPAEVYFGRTKELA